MRYIIALLSICLLGFASMGICQDEELPPEWLFDDEEDIQKWGGANQLGPLELDDVKDPKGETRSILRTESLGNDPYVFPDGAWGGFVPEVLPFDGGEYTTIYIGIRAEVAHTWQIYYISEEEAGYAETQRQNFEVSASADFQDLEFVMERGGWQERIITGFRIDPGTVAGIETEIDYISLRGIPDGLEQAVEYSGKLASTWGSIKN